jgi:hypothetical protein
VSDGYDSLLRPGAGQEDVDNSSARIGNSGTILV